MTKFVELNAEGTVKERTLAIEERVTELEAVLKGDQTKMNDEDIVALEEEYMELTGADEVRY